MNELLSSEPVDLHVSEFDGGFALHLDGAPLASSVDGEVLRHPSRDLLDHMVGELMQFPSIECEGPTLMDPPALTSVRLLGIQRRFVERGDDNLLANFRGELTRDRMLERVAGPEERDRQARYAAVVDWLALNDLRLVDLDFVDLEGIEVSLPGHVRLNDNMGADHTDAFVALASFLESTFSELSPEERTGVVMLHNLHRGAVVHALALVTGNCTSVEYALGVGAAHHVISVYGDVSDVAHTQAYRELKSDADVVLEYVSAFRRGTLAGLIRSLSGSDETADVEFKSSLRFNMREGRKDRAMTDVVVKTVAGFLNTAGGTLLIGVDDDGALLGLEPDAFDSSDRFLLHLYTALNNGLGVHASTLVRAEVETVDGKDVCVVRCRPSETAVMCVLKGKEPQLFVRTGPQTVPVEGEQRDDYLRTHWSGDARS